MLHVLPLQFSLFLFQQIFQQKGLFLLSHRDGISYVEGKKKR